jgi:MoxR-like ATPase
MEDERLVIRQNLKGSYESKSVVSVEQILRAKKQFVRCTWMKNRKYILISFYHALSEKYKLADLKPLISFGASPRGSINWRMQNVTLLSNVVVM